MQGLTSSYKLSLMNIVVFLLGLLTAAGVAHGRKTKKLVSSYDEPCQKMTVYLQDILYDGSNTANATSVIVVRPSLLSRSVSINDTYFGEVAVFNDVVTAGPALTSEPVARGQGLYMFDAKDRFNAWVSFSLVFNSTAHRGTLTLMGADLMYAKTRDISVVGGTGDFFMARGIATLATDSIQGLYYFRLKMDIKLYECYV